MSASPSNSLNCEETSRLIETTSVVCSKTRNLSDINTISLTEIERILERRPDPKNISSNKLALRIDDYRKKYAFRKLDDLRCVTGVGTKTLTVFHNLLQNSSTNKKDDCRFEHLPPHVRYIVDDNQVCEDFSTAHLRSIKPEHENALLILHLNINGLERKLSLLKELIEHTNADIVCVSETNNPLQDKVQIKNFTLYLNNNQCVYDRSSGGVAMYVRSNLVSKKASLSEASNRDGDQTKSLFTEVRIKEKKSFIVGVMYRHPKRNHDKFQNFKIIYLKGF